METATLARRIFGHLVPDISFKRQLGEDSATEDQQPLLVYVMTRMRGISRLDFILTYGFPENSPHNMTCRKNVVRDVARSGFQCYSTGCHAHLKQVFCSCLEGTTGT